MTAESSDSQTKTTGHSVNVTVKHLLQLEFIGESFQRMKRLKERANGSTFKKVIVDALRLYEWYLLQKKKEWRIQLVKDDVVKEIELLF